MTKKVKSLWKKWCNLVDLRNEGIDYSCYEEAWSPTTPLLALTMPSVIVIFSNLIVMAYDGTFIPFKMFVGFWLFCFAITCVWLIWHFKAYFPKQKN